MSNTAAPERGSIDAARAAWSQQRHDETASLREAAQSIRRSGVTTLAAIANAMQARGLKTPAGGMKWHRAQVSRLLDDESSPAPALVAPALVHVTITANYVPLPVEPDDTVRPGWASAERTTPVNRGRRLCVPPDLAELLEYHRQAVRLSSR